MIYEDSRSKQSKNRPHLQGDTVAIPCICVHLLSEHVKHIQRPFCLMTADGIHTFKLILPAPLNNLYREVKG